MVDALATIVIRSAKDVLQRMTALPVVEETPFVKRNGKLTLCGVTGMVGLAGDYIGMLSLHFSKELALEITSRMLQTSITEVDEDVKDAIGELTNMVAGNLKTALSKSGVAFDLSVPSVIIGERYFTEYTSELHSLVVPFTVGSQKLFLELALKKGYAQEDLNH